MIAGSVTFLSRLDLALYIGGESSSAYICKHAFFKLKGEKKIKSIERKSNVIPPHKKSDREKHVKRKKDGDKRKSQQKKKEKDDKPKEKKKKRDRIRVWHELSSFSFTP